MSNVPKKAIPVKVLPISATIEDVQEMMGVFKEAFGPDPLMEFCFNRPNVSHTPKEEQVAKHLERIESGQFLYHKAVSVENPNGPILGVAAWYWVADPLNSTQNIPWGDPPAGVHLECYEGSFGSIRRWRLNYFREHDQPFAYMAILTVLPEAQRRCVGSALLREGLREADRRGLPAFIEASPKGRGLYKKFGWEDMYASTVNLKDYGGEDLECVRWAMIRPSGAKEMVEAPTTA
jgi:GNAT superfamily N-acetyltransferase